VSRSVGSGVVTVNDVLDGHTVLDLSCLDRLYLSGFVQRLQTSYEAARQPSPLPVPGYGHGVCSSWCCVGVLGSGVLWTRPVVWGARGIGRVRADHRGVVRIGGQALACLYLLSAGGAEAPGSRAAAGRRAAMRSTLEAGGAAPYPRATPTMISTNPSGGDRAGWGWPTGALWWLRPLPLSYTRVGIAGLRLAGWCPSLRTRIMEVFTGLTGIVPAAARVPVGHRSWGIARRPGASTG
jgi:hypothetical protein